MPRILLTLTALLTASAVAVGCGSDGASSSAASAVAPAGSVMYGEATLKPEGDQKAAIDSLVEKFPGEGPAGERVRDLMEKAFADSDSGLSYKKDVEPWLGDEAAFFVSRLDAAGDDGDGAFVVATDDEEKALAALDKGIDGKKRDYKGTEYFTEDQGAAGVVDGLVVLGTVPAFKAAVDVADDGRSLEDDEKFQKTLEDAPEDRLGYFYINSPALLETLEQSPAGAQLGPLKEFLQGAPPGHHERRRVGRSLRGHRVQVARRRLPGGGRGRGYRRPAPGRLLAGHGAARPGQDARQVRGHLRRAARWPRQRGAAVREHDRTEPAGRRALLDGRLGRVRARDQRLRAGRRIDRRDQRRGEVRARDRHDRPLRAPERRRG